MEKGNLRHGVLFPIAWMVRHTACTSAVEHPQLPPPVIGELIDALPRNRCEITLEVNPEQSIQLVYKPFEQRV